MDKKLSANKFNYDTNLTEKKTTNYKNLNETNSDKSTAKILINPTNFIVNRLYDELDLIPEAQINLPTTSEINQNLCTSSCKCSVEVITDKTLNNFKSINRRCVINIKDCDCSKNLTKNSYGNVLQDEKESFTKETDDDDEQYLNGTNLLNFSKQIAMGMVSFFFFVH